MATAALLPRADVGDHIVVLDTGAYTLSMHSRYNSRCSPAVYGFTAGTVRGGGVRLARLRGREALADVLRFWNMGMERAPTNGKAP